MYNRIVSRPKTVNGKRVPLSTRVSEERAREFDDARGMMSRSAALDEALGFWLEHRRMRKPAPRTRRTSPVPFSSAGRQ